LGDNPVLVFPDILHGQVYGTEELWVHLLLWTILSSFLEEQWDTGYYKINLKVSHTWLATYPHSPPPWSNEFHFFKKRNGLNMEGEEFKSVI
jgi:hypothetical protein